MFKTAGLRPQEIEELKAMEANGIKFNKSSFGFTSYSDESVYNLLNTRTFDQLNDQLCIQDYGTGIEEIIFAFIALAPQFFRQEQNVEYYADDRLISIGLELNYEKFVAADEKGAQEMMKKCYLRGLKSIAVFEIEDFDLERLCKDVEGCLNGF